jgi:hypothetical protein
VTKRDKATGNYAKQALPLSQDSRGLFPGQAGLRPFVQKELAAFSLQPPLIPRIFQFRSAILFHVYAFTLKPPTQLLWVSPF